jgi:hypothetical protein
VLSVFLRFHFDDDDDDVAKVSSFLVVEADGKVAELEYAAKES